MMLTLARDLWVNGVVGINMRNADYVLRYNRRKFYPLVDDKLRTKEIAEEVGINVPDLYGKIEFPHEVRNFPSIVANRTDFVVKPAQGSGGDGILVVVGRLGDHFRLAGGDVMSMDDMMFHLNNILAGTFSLGGQPDRALIEYRVDFDPVFEQIAFRGVPDVRIVVFLGVPVMAMVRLPTRLSRGKANLHQGAIGAGVALPTGRTLTAVLRNAVVTEHPDTYNAVTGVEIPGWRALLDMAARSYELTNLGYQGIDIVLDKARGPLLLELNARPGLNIQIANREGLRHRLDHVAANAKDLSSAADRVAFSVENFAPKPVGA
ncbi:MAG: alpha-L-glutamate ligase-like protein [Alphaproteobacteria bacterium]|nr:alpha-L-glutamate ligase-like protein [Alphaproteobacteria bacterium]